jgi:hypothetical protein
VVVVGVELRLSYIALPSQFKRNGQKGSNRPYIDPLTPSNIAPSGLGGNSKQANVNAHQKKSIKLPRHSIHMHEVRSNPIVLHHHLHLTVDCFPGNWIHHDLMDTAACDE